MNKNKSMTDILSIRTLEKIQDQFSEATGIGSVIRDLKGKPVTKFSKPSKLWMEVIKNPAIEKELEPNLLEGIEKCLKSGQTQIINRYMDTHAFIVPIGLDGQTIGVLVGGLVRYSNPDIPNCAKEAQRLGLELDTFLEMYLELPLISKEKLEADANLFKIITNSISALTKDSNEAKAKIEELIAIKNMLEKELEIASIELKNTTERYSRIFNTVQEGIYETDMQGIIKDINPAGANILGYQRSELIGKNICDLYINRENRNNFINLLISKHKLEKFQPNIRLKDGTIGNIETTSSLIFDQNGNTIGIQGIFHEISQRQHRMIKQKDNVPATTNLASNKNQ